MYFSRYSCSSWVKASSWVSQLCLALKPCCLSVSMLFLVKWVMMFEKMMCSIILEHTRQGDRSVITGSRTVAFLENRTYIGQFPIVGKFPITERRFKNDV